MWLVDQTIKQFGVVVADPGGIHRLRKLRSVQAVADAAPDYDTEGHVHRRAAMAANHGGRRLHGAEVSEAGPADELGLYTGTHGQFHLNWTLLRSTSFAIEELQFQVGDAIRCAGGHNGDYIGIQIAYGW